MYIIVFWHYVNMYFFYNVYINIKLQIILFFSYHSFCKLFYINYFKLHLVTGLLHLGQVTY